MGAQFPGRRITAEGAEKSQKRVHLIPKKLGWGIRLRTWGHQTCFLPQATSNLVTPLGRLSLIKDIVFVTILKWTELKPTGGGRLLSQA